jgi:DNA-binding transcriptional LysR family regulator
MEHSVSDLATPTNLRDLRAFCLIVIHGSITEAAKDLGETRGSVSRRMSRLERDLGVTLLRRTTRSVQPTEEGIRYHRHAEQALELLRDAAAGIQTAVPRGRLRVATSHGFALWAIAPLIGEFSRLYPQIRLDFVLTDEPPNFTGRELDAAIYPAHRLPDSSLIANRLLDWEPKLVASPAYIEAFGAPSSAGDLQKFSVILGMGFAPRLKSGIIQSSARANALRGQTLLPNAIVSTSTAFAREAALAGAGIALVPDFLVRNDLEEKRLIEVLPQQRPVGRKGSMFLLYPATRFVSPAVKAFRDFLVSHIPARPLDARARPKQRRRDRGGR